MQYLIKSAFLLLNAITRMGFTKNNHLRSGIRYANALPAVIIFIRICVFDVLFSVKNKGRSKLEANGFSVTNSRDC